MSDTPTRNDLARSERSVGDAGPEGGRQRAAKRKRRGWRIAFVSLASVFALVAAVAVGGVLALNHLASSIRRIPVTFAKLAVADRPVAGSSGGAMTVLITGAGIAPTGSVTGPAGPSGLIMLLHINANHQAGGVVSIPPQAMVQVPGHRRAKIENALALGGPSLLVQTIEQLTHVQIDHYARIDLSHVANVVNAVGGVDVTLPETTTSFGHTFHVGTNHLDGVTALDYARQPSLTEEGRVLRQQSLIRAVLSRIANARLLINPVTTYHVLSALTALLTVDSNFTNSQLATLASELKSLSGGAGTYVTAPTRTSGGGVLLDPAISKRLWEAIRQDSIAAFAHKYPSTVTPQAVP